MAKSKKDVRCIYCNSEILDNDECPNCSIKLSDMIPKTKPEKFEDPGKISWWKGFAIQIPFIPFIIIAIIFLSEKINESIFDSSNGFIAFLLTFILVEGIAYIIISIIYSVWHEDQYGKYILYERKMKLYRLFAKSEEEENKEKEEFLKRNEEEERMEKAMKNMAKILLKNELENRFGAELASISYSKSGFYGIYPSDQLLKLYSDYLVVCNETNILEVIDLGCFTGCELYKDRLNDSIHILLTDPSSQSKFDEFVNGKKGKRLYMAKLKTCTKDRELEINKFYNMLKKEMNK